MSWGVALLTVLLAGGFDDFRQVRVRIEGYLDATRKETQAWQELDVRVGDGPMRKFAMMDIKSLSGGPVMGVDLLQQVEMIKPNFIFTGSDELIQEIATAKPNQLLKITGYTQLGSQYVLVETVERSEPITGPTPTPSLREKLLGF